MDNAERSPLTTAPRARAPPGKNKTGVYFLCESCKGNLLKNSRIYNHFYGVLFRSTLTAQTPNRLTDSDLHDTLCDGVTFIGYGEVVGGLSTSIAFRLGNRPGSDGVAVANSVTNNAFHAFVAQGGVGLGFFTTRGTGYGPGQSWSAQTTNYFTGNTTFGPNVGSVRCGGDWCRRSWRSAEK